MTSDFRMMTLIDIGDLAAVSRDGSIHCFGRIDNQVKIRGQRIELEEVERVLTSAGAGHSVLVSKVTRNRGEALCVLISPSTPFNNDQMSVLVAEFEELARSHLPTFAIPRHWVPCKDISLDSNGKVNRRAANEYIAGLSDAELDRFAAWPGKNLLNDARAPETSVELVLAECFSQVLGPSELFRSSDFFALGGDSISAMRLCAVAKYRGLNLTVSAIYRHANLEQLASSIETQVTDLGSVAAKEERNRTVYITPVMKWFFSQQKQNPDWYHQIMTIKLKAYQDLEKIPLAWSTIIKTHPALSMRWPSQEANHTLLAHHQLSESFGVTRGTLSSISLLTDSLCEVASKIRLDTGPTSHLGLFQVKGEAFCVLCVHHLAVDIVSWQIIMEDLTRLLKGHEILAENCTFMEHSLRLRTLRSSASTKKGILQPLPMCSETLEQSEAHMNHALLGACDGESLLYNTVATAKVVKSEWSPELTSQLLYGPANRNARTEVVDLILSALLVAFKRWRKVKQIEICFESHGRTLDDESIDLSRTVGWFTYMMSASYYIHDDFDRLIAEVKEQRSMAVRNVDLSMPFTGFGHHAPVVTFNYSGAYSSHNDDGVFTLVDIGENRADEDPCNRRPAILDVGCGISDGILATNIIYSTTLHNEEEMRDVLHDWMDCLRMLLHHFDGTTTKYILTRRELPFLPLQHQEIATLVQSNLEPNGIYQASIENIVPVTDVQKSMILASQEYGSYLEKFVYRIQGDLDIRNLTSAWEKVAGKHVALRSVFVNAIGDQPTLRGEILQVVLRTTHMKPLFYSESEIQTPFIFEYGKPMVRMQVRRIGHTSSFQFVWQYHHALLDGWSTGVVIRDFEQAYLERSVPRVVPFESIRCRISEVQNNQSVLDFWRQELAGAMSTRLRDYSGSQKMKLRDWRYDQAIDCDYDAVATYAALQSTTMSTVLRAAWAITLSYFCDAEDVIFGVTTSGRDLDVEGIEEIVGPCVNTVPFRMKVLAGDSKETHVNKVHVHSATLFEHDKLSLRGIYRASGQTDLFDSTFVFQNYKKFAKDPDLPFTMELEEAEEKTDIPFNVMVSKSASGSLHFAVLMHRSILSESYVENVCLTFARVLNWFCGQCQENCDVKRLGDLTLLDHCERAKINNYGVGLPVRQHSQTVWQLFADQTRDHASQTAIEFISRLGMPEIATYGEIYDKTETTARSLFAQGIGSGDRVVLYMDKSSLLIIIMLALSRLGAVCVPVRLGLPQERIEMLIADVDPKLVIAFGMEKDISPGRLFQTAEGLLEPESSVYDWALPGVDDDPENASLILFTSGTTGVPKGVCMPNRQVTGYACSMAEAYRYDEHSRIFCFANYTFDVYITDVFGGLSAGSTLCIVDEETMMNDLKGSLERSRATHINLTPSVAAMLSPESQPHLRSIVLTGEPLTASLLSTWASKIHVVNSYGKCFLALQLRVHYKVLTPY
jgi:non-ribosomal peptide synthetase component F/aryl carrier-like protein